VDVDDVKGHYYLPYANDHFWAMLPQIVEKSGPQMLHWHTYTEDCEGLTHTYCTDHGNQKITKKGNTWIRISQS
jgi:hypothetical protein